MAPVSRHQTVGVCCGLGHPRVLAKIGRLLGCMYYVFFLQLYVLRLVYGTVIVSSKSPPAISLTSSRVDDLPRFSSCWRSPLSLLTSASPPSSPSLLAPTSPPSSFAPHHVGKPSGSPGEDKLPQKVPHHLPRLLPRHSSTLSRHQQHFPDPPTPRSPAGSLQ